jgi:hypothetical protein
VLAFETQTFSKVANNIFIFFRKKNTFKTKYENHPTAGTLEVNVRNI